MVRGTKETTRDRPRFEAHCRLGRNRFTVVLDDVDLTRLKVAIVIAILGLAGALFGLDFQTIRQLIRLLLGG